MRLLDLYCGAGYAAKGYADAGFEVVGVDIEPQPNYPYEFHQGDALETTLLQSLRFDAVHASPPCQFGTELRHAPGAKTDHPNLIPATREMLRKFRLPYVIENVSGASAHLVLPVMLCGSMFDLGCYALGGAGSGLGDWYQLRRHRHFECSFPVTPPSVCKHFGPTIGIYGGHVRNRSAGYGGRGTVDFPNDNKPALAHQAMGAHWGTMAELSQGIPPAYTHHIGRALKDHLDPWRKISAKIAGVD